jgi:hypothetical protein
MNRNLIYFPILLIVLVFFTLSLITTIESLFNSAIGQVDPSQEQIEPIPPSNNTNTNQTTPIAFSQ